MGQLLDRMFRVAKSYLNDIDSRGISFNREDEDLKKIIDDLNKEQRKHKAKENGKSETNSHKKSEDTSREQKMGFDMAYKILKVNASSSVEEIKKAYKDRVREYHPDRVANMGEELRQVAEQKTQMINEAYAYLRKNRGF